MLCVYERNKMMMMMMISTVNCDEMVGNRPRQHAYEIFSIKRRF